MRTLLDLFLCETACGVFREATLSISITEALGKLMHTTGQTKRATFLWPSVFAASTPHYTTFIIDPQRQKIMERV